jgi:mRNA interferase MazF
MGEQPRRADSAGDRQAGPPQRRRLSGPGSPPRLQHRLALNAAEVRTLGTCIGYYGQESSSGNAVGKGERRRILYNAKSVLYDVKSVLELVCPMTNQTKGYPFEVAVPDGHGASGVILADHVRSVDWKARRAEKVGHCPTEVIDEVRARLAPLLGH